MFKSLSTLGIKKEKIIKFLNCLIVGVFLAGGFLFRPGAVWADCSEAEFDRTGAKDLASCPDEWCDAGPIPGTNDSRICWPPGPTTQDPVCKQGVFNYDPNDTTKRCCRVCTGGRGCGPCISEPSCSNANLKYSPASKKCENYTGGEYKIDPSIHCDPGADGVGVEGVQSAIGCIPTGDLPKFLAFILKFALGAAGGVILLMFIATGYTLITSTGNPEKLQAVKENLTSIFAGLIMIGFSLVLLQTIGAGVLQLPGF